MRPSSDDARGGARGGGGGVALAQEYSDKPVKIIVPFAAGGPADVYARFLDNALSEAPASRSSSKTARARARSSAPTPSQKAHRTAIRC
jgi:tripartite-type tricarboxylate transporter receptor subunit TctC